MVWRRRKRNYPTTLPTKLTTTATVIPKRLEVALNALRKEAGR